MLCRFQDQLLFQWREYKVVEMLPTGAVQFVFALFALLCQQVLTD
jgi:hypothetical protein